MGGFGAIALFRKYDLTLCKSVAVELLTKVKSIGFAHGGTFVTWDSTLDLPLANSTTAHDAQTITAFFAFGIWLKPANQRDGLANKTHCSNPKTIASP
jgi:hypothetical protein